MKATLATMLISIWKRTIFFNLLILLVLFKLSSSTVSPLIVRRTNVTTVTNASESLRNKSKPLPPGWDRFCMQVSESVTPYIDLPTNTLFYYCHIDQEYTEQWELSVLRLWIKFSPHKYFFKIKCETGAKIRLPWPAKSKNLIGLKVENCIIRGWFDDAQNSALNSIADEMKTLTLQNNVVVLELIEFFSYISAIDKVTKDLNCGQEESLHEIILRNISYDFVQGNVHINPGNSIDDEKGFQQIENTIMKSGSAFFKNSRKIEFVCNFKNLNIIDRSYAEVSNLHTPIITERSLFPELLVFNLSNSHVVEIAPEFLAWPRYFPKLNQLDLSYNTIQTPKFDQPFLNDDNHTLQVNLTHNNITMITEDTIHMLASLPNVMVQISNNPFNCKCSIQMKNLLKLIKDEDVWTRPSYNRYSYIRRLSCATPKSAQGKMFINLSGESMECETGISVVTIVCFCIVIVILLIIIIAMAKFRREIQILTYTRFNIILPCQSTEPYQNKVFDAFVSYNNADELWVQKTFIALEEGEVGNASQKFQFCLHQRDFIAGKPIFDNVIESVESSRHTIIIISRNFLQSQWCMYEFQEAFKQSILERKRHMIMVMLEDIHDSELPKDLKRCMKTFTYIRKDDSIFLDRLIFALSYKGQKSDTNRSDVSKVIIHDEAFNEVFEDTIQDLETSECAINSSRKDIDVSPFNMATIDCQIEFSESDPTKETEHFYTTGFDDESMIYKSDPEKEKGLFCANDLESSDIDDVVSPTSSTLTQEDNMKSYDKPLINKDFASELGDDNHLNVMKLGFHGYTNQVSYEPNIGGYDDENYVSITSDMSEINNAFYRRYSEDYNSHIVEDGAISIPNPIVEDGAMSIQKPKDQCSSEVCDSLSHRPIARISAFVIPKLEIYDDTCAMSVLTKPLDSASETRKTISESNVDPIPEMELEMDLIECDYREKIDLLD